MKKTETIAEFLARGGKITRVPTPEPTAKIDSIKSTNNGGAVTIVSMDDADLYYGEQKIRKAKKKAASTSVIDISALPEALRKKYVDEVINGQEENDEDDSE